MRPRKPHNASSGRAKLHEAPCGVIKTYKAAGRLTKAGDPYNAMQGPTRPYRAQSGCVKSSHGLWQRFTRLMKCVTGKGRNVSDEGYAAFLGWDG